MRQLLEQQGFYSLEKPIGDMKTVVDTRWAEVMWLARNARCGRQGAEIQGPAVSTHKLHYFLTPPPPCPNSYVAAMVTPGAGRNDIPNRLKRQFAIFHVPPPSEAAINDIFGTLVAGRFDAPTFSPEVGWRDDRVVGGVGVGRWARGAAGTSRAPMQLQQCLAAVAFCAH